MGLLDKADDISEKSAKATAEKKKPMKAKPAKAPKEVKPKKEPKAAKPKKERKPKREKVVSAERIDPDELDFATGLNRSLSWFVDVAVNFGLLFASLPMMMFDSAASGTPLYTWLLAVGGLAFFANTIFIPALTGRTMGHFVTRINFLDSRGGKPIFIHPIMNNLIGPLALMGFFMIAFQFQNLDEGGKAMTMFIIGCVTIIIFGTNFFIKRASEYNQGIFDLLFGCYLVKYVSTGSESSNWLFAKLENMGNFGDAWQAKIEARREKSDEKAAAKDESSNDESEDEK